MSKETAKKLIEELQTNEELQAKVEGITDPEELAKKAVEAGYDVTVEDLVEAEKEMKAKTAARNDELSADELESAAGGNVWRAEDASDGHELLCHLSYHDYGWMEEHNEWCKSDTYKNVQDRIDEVHHNNHAKNRRRKK
jgi:predicted ribosomally synthesized peptide with nif11-like leader